MRVRVRVWSLGLAVLASTVMMVPLYAQQPGNGWEAASPPSSQQRRQHVMDAIEHLESGGFHEQSQELRKVLVSLDRELTQRILMEKLRQMETLRADISKLREQLGPASELVHVDVEVLELSLDKLRKNRIDLQRIHPQAGEMIVKLLTTAQPGGQGCQILADGDNFRRKVAALRENSLVRRLANPQIITTSGQQASIHIGGQQPVIDWKEGQIKSLKYEDFGIRLNICPEVIAERQLRMDLNFLQRGRSEPGQSAPSHVANASSKVDSGKTLLICARPKGKQHDGQGMGIVILVTPRLVNDQRVTQSIKTVVDPDSAPNCTLNCGRCPLCPEAQPHRSNSVEAKAIFRGGRQPQFVPAPGDAKQWPVTQATGAFNAIPLPPLWRAEEPVHAITGTSTMGCDLFSQSHCKCCTLSDSAEGQIGFASGRWLSKALSDWIGE